MQNTGTAEDARRESTGATVRLEESGPGLLPLIFTGTIFLGACLLFQVELIISKYLLPWFGGSAAVWATSMLVFQVLLFGGYAYAHALSTRAGATFQARIHSALVFVSLLALVVAASRWPSPITPSAAWKPATPDRPIANIILVLVTSIAIPFFVLSSAGPLLQRWYTRVTSNSPYRLYAVSNLGSLLGLFAYPLVVEPFLRVRTQAWLWAGFYALFAAGMLLCARCTPATMASAAKFTSNVPAGHPGAGQYLMWISLAACASVALLAVTNEISEKLTPLPLIWVLPLGAYLITFIICFAQGAWYKRGLLQGLFGLTALISLFAPFIENAKLTLGNLLALLFAICMICHGELVRLKPSSRHLTGFYLAVSGGGAIGGILVALVAPTLFPAVWEFPLVLGGTAVLAAIVLLRDKTSWLFGWSRWPIVPLAAAAVLVPLSLARIAIPQARGQLEGLLKNCNYYPIGVLLFLPGLLAAVVFGRASQSSGASRFRPVQAAAAAALVLFAYTYVRVWQHATRNTVVQTRDFYGTLSVTQLPMKNLLIHGRTIHGEQWRSSGMRRVPTAYYATTAGIGQLLRYHPKRVAGVPMRIGVVGLGAGTIAAYGQSGDRIRFYEIDPGVLDLVRGPRARFSFLADSNAEVDVVLGDARIAMEQEAARGEFQKFDVLVLDAFSGDAIPVHLLTREAVELYLQHLSGPEGVLAVHISSAMLDLRPVLSGIADHFRLQAQLVQTADPINSAWIMLSRDPASISTPGLLKLGRPLADKRLLWTDDFSNLLQALR
jgi:hypothetical protein